MNAQEQNKECIFKVVVLAGEILLANGAEIFRVEETMWHIAHYYNMDTLETFLIANGIFATAEGKDYMLRAKIKHVTTGNTDLGKIEAVNDLSRKIVSGTYTLDDAYERLLDIQQQRDKNYLKQLGAYGVCCSSFCYLLGGTYADAVIAFFSGIILGCLILYTTRRTAVKTLMIIIGSGVATFFCIMMHRLGLGDNLDKMIIGSIIPLVPGVSFTNAVRDLMENNYLSGMVRMMDALLVAMSMAIGVGVIWRIFL